MESSEEEDIINNDEDDYGEFSEKNKNIIKITEESNIIILDKDNSNKNIQTEKDEIISNENKEIKEEKNDNNNIINANVKKNNLIIVNKVIDLNISQNRNKKQTKELNSQQFNITNQNFEYSEENENENKNDNNNVNIIQKKAKKIQKNNKYQKKKINLELNKNKIKEKYFEEQTIQENNINNLGDIKINEIDKPNKYEKNEESENNEQEEEEESWEKEENNLIIETKQTKQLNSNEDINKQKEDAQIIIPKNNNLCDLINDTEEKDKNIKIKENELSDIEIESEGKLDKNINNNLLEIKINNLFNNEKEEKRIINGKKVYKKNSNIKKNENDSKTFSKDLNIEKSINLDQLKENQNIYKETPTKLETNFESPSRLFQKNETINNKEKEYMLSESKKLKNRNEEKNINNNPPKYLSMSVSNIMNIKSNSSSYFNNLLTNKTFVKFLNHKLEQSKNKEDEVPKKFLENLSVKSNIQNTTKENKPKKTEDTNTTVNYSLFYNEDNYEFPLFNKKFRRTVNTQFKSPKTNSINLDFIRRYDNDISVPQYDNSNDSIIKQQEPSRFTTSGFNHYNDNISNLTLKNQELHDKIIELQNEIRTSKNEMNIKNSELQKYSSTYNKMTLENNLNKEKIDELKKELKLQKGAMNEKENKISQLENINTTLKNEMTKLQKNYDEETITNKEVKQNYDIIKANYNDIKNQYDLLNIKYQSLTDENFNFKRDKALYEKQIKTKNEMIESLIENKTNILNNKKFKFDSIEEKEKEESNHEMYLDYIKNKNLSKELLLKEKEKEKDNGLKKVAENENGENKLYIDYTKFDKLTYPELQSKRDELINERKNINNIFNKIPIRSGYKSQIQKRNDLEQKLNDINCDLAIIKLRMKNLKK